MLRVAFFENGPDYCCRDAFFLIKFAAFLFAGLSLVDAHRMFDEIPREALQTQSLKINWTSWCYRCGGMASGRTYPHADAELLLVSGTKLRK